jgi:hypothetical protein
MVLLLLFLTGVIILVAAKKVFVNQANSTVALENLIVNINTREYLYLILVPILLYNRI